MKINLFLMFGLHIFISGCSSSMTSFYNPIVAKPGEVKGGYIYGTTNSMEMHIATGVGYDFDVRLKFSPIIAVAVTERSLRFPLEIDVKYQILSNYFKIASGVGWSNLVTRKKDDTLELMDRVKSYRIYSIFGISFLYGSVTANFFEPRKTFIVGDDQGFIIPSKNYFISYSLGTSIGNDIGINPEITFLPSGNVYRSVFGINLKFTSGILEKL